MTPLPRHELVPLSRTLLDDGFVICSDLAEGGVLGRRAKTGLSLVNALLQSDSGFAISVDCGPPELEGL